MIKKTLMVAALFLAVMAGAAFASVPASQASTGGIFAQWQQWTQPWAQQQSSFPALNSPAGKSNSSLNWAGYEAGGGGYTSVSGTWTVPSVPVANATQADATWVGIGGISSRDLIQGGTQEIVNGAQGVSYIAWYETLPQASQSIPITIHPGDSVSVSLMETAADSNVWNFSFRDNTTGQSYQTSITYQSSNSSAEWIEEMPTDVNTFVPLDSFGSIPFTGASAVKNGNAMSAASAGATPITMTSNGGQTLASPSAIGADGGSFAVARSATAATTATTTTTRGFGGRSWRRTGVGVQGYTAPRVPSVTKSNAGNGTITVQILGWRFGKLGF